mgnify:CR=1 FL=1
MAVTSPVLEKTPELRLGWRLLRGLDRNPLRILDSKDPGVQAMLADAPVLADYLGEASRSYFDGFLSLLDGYGLAYQVNPRLVRGLDYYSHAVFEWITDELGAQGTVCAGGRYDGLVEIQGGKPWPGVGFAMGQERLIELMRQAEIDLREAVSEHLSALDNAPLRLILSFHAGTACNAGEEFAARMLKTDACIEFDYKETLRFGVAVPTGSMNEKFPEASVSRLAA